MSFPSFPIHAPVFLNPLSGADSNMTIDGSIKCQRCFHHRHHYYQHRLRFDNSHEPSTGAGSCQTHVDGDTSWSHNEGKRCVRNEHNGMGNSHVNPTEHSQSLSFSQRQLYQLSKEDSCHKNRLHSEEQSCPTNLPCFSHHHNKPQPQTHQRSEKRGKYFPNPQNQMIFSNLKMVAVFIMLTLTCHASPPPPTTPGVVAVGGDENRFGRFDKHPTPTGRGHWSEPVVETDVVEKDTKTSPSFGILSNSIAGSLSNNEHGHVPTKTPVYTDIPFYRAHSSGFISLTDDITSGALVGADGEVHLIDPQLSGVLKNSTKVTRIGPCLCWNTTDDGQKREVECKCTGQEMTNIAVLLPEDIHRLTVEHAINFTSLGNDDLRPYGGSLSELVLTELPSFQTLNNGTFDGLEKLNTIYIHGTPALTQISDDVLNVDLPELKIIRITHSSLEVCPNLSNLRIKHDTGLHMVELENNKIAQLLPGSFQGLVTQDLALSYNNLEKIGPYAFNGSEIARLTLKGNPLKVLDSQSFVGIKSLRVLDLSETKITFLPTHGLQGLEKLRLEKVWTLSFIPSIYHFQELQEAWLTWPYHCCAFEFPETHDPKAFQGYQEFVRKMRENFCQNKKGDENSSPGFTESSDGPNNENKSPQNDSNISRHRRHLRLFEGANDMRGITSTDSQWGRAILPSSDTSHKIGAHVVRKSVTSISNAQLRKRSVNGHHPRQSRRENGSGKNDKDEKTGSTFPSIRDGFHHPHVHPGNGNPSHAFDNDDTATHHFGQIDPEDSYDPYVFNPDQSFSSPILSPNELERESDIMGKDTWATFENSHEVEYEDKDGFFHTSVTASPTVVTSICGKVAVKKPSKIACRPLPDAFNPCEDIMGSIWLRGAVWVVVALALFGNTAVLVVLLLAPGRISVQRFLMANLSWADLCMGLYLLMVATQDLVSLGSYFNYAIDWQLGWGCQIAGFLTVFASELSVFTLAVITGERWYALTRAIHLTKRLTLMGAAQLMAFGWFMAILLAALPLLGVSSYSKTSICLPMEANSGGAVAYLVFLLLFNGIAFLLVACAYWHMYRAVAGHGRPGSGAAPAASSADTAIAKKMALLVFTDFACWAPVAFFGLTAVGGFPLIGVTDSKILLVFFYPLNACCNPYLYAILTKQYRRDLLLLLSRHGVCTKRAAKYKPGAASTINTMQTMQTVLRMGSMTETKVAGNGGDARTGLLNGGRPSIAAHSITELDSPPENEGLLTFPKKTGTQATSSSHERLNPEQITAAVINNDSSMKPRPNNFTTGLKTNGTGKPKTSPGFLHTNEADEDDDVFDLNGVSGRNYAETSFISVPLTSGKSKLGKGESGKASHGLSQSDNGDLGGKQIVSELHKPVHSPNREKLIDSNGLKEENELDHEITETTPFCS